MKKVHNTHREPILLAMTEEDANGIARCCADRLAAAMAEQIYTAYPYKVGRPVALRAIRKALRNHDFDFLLERTQLFAQIRNGDKSFIPNPSTWYNQERFNDDPSTWKRVTDNKAPVRRENINVPITRR